MLNGGREGLFELGQQLQQQGEYQAALHCFLSCLLGLTHVQSFTSLPNCLHQVSQMGTGYTHTHKMSHSHRFCLSLCLSLHMCQHEFTCVLPTSTHFLPYHVFAQLHKHICITSPFERHKLANITTQRTHSVYSMSNLAAQSIMGLCVDTVKSFSLVELMMCMLLLAVLNSNLM